MTDELRQHAEKVLAASRPGAAGGDFFAEIAWSELLEVASGVPRLQLGAILTRQPPGRLAEDATGSDVARTLAEYRDEVTAAGEQSGNPDARARLDANLAALEQLGRLGVATVTPDAAPAPAGQTLEATPAPAAAAAEHAARKAELTKVATALAGAVDRAERSAATAVRARSAQSTTAVRYPPPNVSARTPQQPPPQQAHWKPEPNLAVRILRAGVVLCLIHLGAVLVLDDSNPANWYLVAFGMAVALGQQLSRKTKRTVRMVFGAVPGAMLTIAALAWYADLAPLAYLLVLGVGLTMNVVYFVAAVRMSWRDPGRSGRRA